MTIFTMKYFALMTIFIRNYVRAKCIYIYIYIYIVKKAFYHVRHGNRTTRHIHKANRREWMEKQNTNGQTNESKSKSTYASTSSTTDCHQSSTCTEFRPFTKISHARCKHVCTGRPSSSDQVPPCSKLTM